MPPYLPVISLNRSQAVRVGRGPGNEVPTALIPNKSVTARNAFYADLAVPEIRRDIQRHSMYGAVQDVGSTSTTVPSDFFSTAGGLALANGTGFAINVSAGNIQSRTYTDNVAVAAQTVTPAAPPAFGGRMDYVCVDATGVAKVVQGNSDTAAPTYGVLSFAIAGVPTAGQWGLKFTWNGFLFTTANTMAFNISGANLVTALMAATGGPNNAALSTYIPSTTLTGGGTALPGGPLTITASGAAEGRIQVVSTFATGTAFSGGTPPYTITATESTVGTGVNTPFPSGNTLCLGSVYIPSTATAASNYVYGTSFTVPTS